MLYGLPSLCDVLCEDVCVMMLLCCIRSPFHPETIFHCHMRLVFTLTFNTAAVFCWRRIEQKKKKVKCVACKWHVHFRLVGSKAKATGQYAKLETEPER